MYSIAFAAALIGMVSAWKEEKPVHRHVYHVPLHGGHHHGKHHHNGYGGLGHVNRHGLGRRLMAHYGDDGDRRHGHHGYGHHGYGHYGHPWHHGHLGGYGYDDHGMQHDDHDDEATADPKHPGNPDYNHHGLGHKVLARKPWHHDHHGYDDFNGYGYYGRPYGYGRRGYGYYGHHAW